MQYYRHNGAGKLPVILEMVRLMDSFVLMMAARVSHFLYLVKRPNGHNGMPLGIL